MAIREAACEYIFGNVQEVNMEETIQEYKRMSDKHLEMFLVMYFWVRNLNNGKRIGDFLRDQGYRHIAIYGAGYMGRCLCEELVKEDIGIDYFIDKRDMGEIMSISVKKAEDDLEPVDAVIVTSVYFIYEIEKELKQIMCCPIFSLSDIVYKL